MNKTLRQTKFSNSISITPSPHSERGGGIGRVILAVAHEVASSRATDLGLGRHMVTCESKL